MFAVDDTIVAISTPTGRGGIGVVRISGSSATGTVRTILKHQAPLEPRRATVTEVISGTSGQSLDQVVVTFFPGPASYTGEDVVEISAHGSPVMLRQIVTEAVQAGSRLAEPGEFTLRAFLNGRIDLVQAEAVGDLINSVTPLQARVAFDQLEGTVTTCISEIEKSLFELVAKLEASVDFPDEGYHFFNSKELANTIHRLVQQTERLLADADRGRLVREGAQVVIIGKPNAGKSTLFNRSLGTSRAIVTDVAGTTRDFLTETLELDGIPITLVDTAGIRSTEDVIESEGMKRARLALSVARLAILVFDSSSPFEEEDRALIEETQEVDRVLLINKIDLAPQWTEADRRGENGWKLERDRIVSLSLLDTDGDPSMEVRRAVTELLLADDERRDVPAITNLRHIELLTNVSKAFQRAATVAADHAPEELVLADLCEARELLEEVTGKRTPEDVLNKIFAEFCIGK